MKGEEKKNRSNDTYDECNVSTYNFDNMADTAYLLKVGWKKRATMMKMENGKEDARTGRWVRQKNDEDSIQVEEKER